MKMRQYSLREKEQITQDIRISFEFLRYLIDHPELIEELPDRAEIEFVGTDLVKKEVEPAAHGAADMPKVYIATRRVFEVMKPEGQPTRA